MAPPARDGSGTTLVATVLALVAIGLGVDAYVEPVAVPQVETEVAVRTAGLSTCAAIDLQDADDLLVASIADAPVPDEGAAGEVPDGVAQLVLEDDGERTALPAPDLTGRAGATLVSGSRGELSVVARWEDVPVLLSRRWTSGAGDRVPGSIEGPCPAETATRWIVPGVATAGGASATLHLANPTDGPAAVAVRFLTPDGPVEPTRLANLVVPAHGRTTVQLNEFAPEQPDLGVEVTARSGQFVVEAVQTLEAAVGGVDGRSLVAARAEPAVEWTIPWASAGEGESSWVWVSNPSDEATDVNLVVHTPNGPIVPPASGATLPPGSSTRIDLRGALGEAGRGGVTVRSTTAVGVVVSGAVVRAVEGDGVRSGIAVLDAIPASSTRQAALSSVGDDGRSRLLALANPGDTDAVVNVSIVGRNALSPTAVLTDATVPGGAWVTVDLAGMLPLDGAWAIVVDVVEGRATASVVSSSTDGPLDLTALLAMPFAPRAELRAPELVLDRALLHPADPDGGVQEEPVGVTADDLIGS